MKERTQEKMVLYWRVAGVTLVGGGEPWVKPIATEGESVAGLMLGNEDVPQIFFLFFLFLFPGGGKRNWWPQRRVIKVCGGSGLDMPEGRSQSRASAPHGAQVYRAKTK